MRVATTTALVGLTALLSIPSPASAQDAQPAAPSAAPPAIVQDPNAATPEEVVTRVLEATRLLHDKGKAAYAEFNDPRGRWVWKDSYVFIYNCDKNEMVAHPLRPDLVGRPLMQIKDDHNKPIFKELCTAGNKPMGGWVEYVWPKPGQGQTFRKITYAHKADVALDYGVQVGAGVYNDDASVEELTRLLERALNPEKYQAL